MRVGMKAIAMCCAGSAGLAGAQDAEFAARWRAGGEFASAAAVLQALGLRETKRDEFVVQYHEVLERPPGAPAGFRAIARARTEGKKTELTWKYRGEKPATAADAKGTAWCPLQFKDPPKYEVDVSLRPDWSASRAWSLSCDSEKKAGMAFPSTLQLKPPGCATPMTRLRAEYEGKRVTVEEWKLPAGAVIEVSLNGSLPHDEATFRRLLEKVRAAQVPLLQQGMTDLAGSCKA